MLTILKSELLCRFSNMKKTFLKYKLTKPNYLLMKLRNSVSEIPSLNFRRIKFIDKLQKYENKK